MSKNTSGPAFPIPGLHNDADFNGMSLRDYFAAKAMHGLIGIADGINQFPHIPGAAYSIADAMIKERDKA